ncbi:hypothetical protein GT037_006030 [Alternaria burnsii]|uniref:Heterokaryon incompatibility domain-containing protein n=1 Tax=Alternaria burnsii TaxID=1187904 RepID=A0A8H7B387_9PLEO|nr:uncharacterized protein GT037_006030 [Alternaria burnsii]KAF7676525.1 hypothetical protein GT037_006030 [Alternaria burnsii]
MINTPSSKPYIYQQLLSNSKLIRVLDVDPAQTSTAAIVGRLRVVDLATSSRFTALSYVWSSSEPDQTIECNGMNVAVSANGHSALQHLRTSLGSYTIWIDALCINQADTKEKEHQVSLMGDIYSRATNVYVWLGEGDDSSDRVMEYMRTAGFLHYFAGCTNNKKGLSQLCLAALSGSMARYSLTRHPFPLRGKIPKRIRLTTLSKPSLPWHMDRSFRPYSCAPLERESELCNLKGCRKLIALQVDHSALDLSRNPPCCQPDRRLWEGTCPLGSLCNEPHLP